MSRARVAYTRRAHKDSRAGGLFPGSDPTTALLASFATFSIAFFARPFGAIVFGHYGDKVGRKATLVAALLTMGHRTRRKRR